jgi:uncharacterized iron-regulated membrane protein
MHLLTGWMGIAMLILIGLSCILGLVMLVLWQVRWIVHSSRQIVGEDESRQFFADVAPSRPDPLVAETEPRRDAEPEVVRPGQPRRRL